MKLFNKLMVMILFLGSPLSAMAANLDVSTASMTLNQTFSNFPRIHQGGTVTNNINLKPLNDSGFSWNGGYIWNHGATITKTAWPIPSSNYPSWTSDGNADASPNYDMLGKMVATDKPYTAANGTFNITAKPMPAYLAKTVTGDDPKAYLSGSITSLPYVQQYGVFAMVAKIPKGKGIWPAFWLLPADESWPPELDVMEVLGGDTSTVYTTVHWKESWGNTQASAGYKTVDLSADFHEYAVDWSPTTITWYLDGKQIFTHATPASLQKPCYLIANLAVGLPSNWGGAPDATTVFPATMQIKSIKAYQRAEYLR